MQPDRPLDLWQLSAFLAVLDAGSFSRASRSLGLSQPTVSLHVSALEDTLGEKLVDRGPPVRPTAAGAALRPVARQLLGLSQEALRSVRTVSQLSTGELRLGASTVPAELLLPAALARFHLRHPAVRVHVKISDTAITLAQLLDGTSEIAYTGAPSGNPQLHETLILEDEVVLVAPPDHPFAARSRIEAIEVASTPLVSREEGSATRRLVESALTRALGRRTGQAVAVELDSSAAVLAAVRAGVAPAFVSRQAAEADFLLRRLVEIPVGGLALRRGLYFVHPSRRYLSPAARAFATLVAGDRQPASKRARTSRSRKRH